MKMAIKQNRRKWLVIASAFFLIAIIQILIFSSYADSQINGSINGVTIVSGSATSTSFDGTNGTLSLSNTKSSEKGAENKSTTITFTNTNSDVVVLSFKYEPSGTNYGTVKVGEENVTTSGSVSTKLSPNATYSIQVEGTDSTGPVGIDLTGLSVVLKQSITVILSGDANGAYTAASKDMDGNAVSETVPVDGSASITFDSTEGLVVTAQPNENYKIYGFCVDGSMVSQENGGTIYPQAGQTVSLSIIPSSYSTPYTVGTFTYYCWEDAIQAAKKGSGIVSLNSNYTLSVADANIKSGNYANVNNGIGEFTIPNGVIFLVPMDDSNTVYTTTPEVVYGSHSNPSAFRTLTVESSASISVANGGKLCVPSKLSATGTGSGSWNGTPTGKHGRINLKSGSLINLNSGAGLYCYGYISGSGSVNALSGSTVYECFQIRSWRGGSCTTSSVWTSNRIFMMNQYYVQNIEAPLTIHAGATEIVYTSVNANKSAYPASADFIGSNGMFNVTSGSITKQYDGATDRLVVSVNGSVTLKALSLDLEITNIDTTDFVLPLTSNITIHAYPQSSITIDKNQDMSFLPGSELILDADSTCTVNSKIYVYDGDQWGAYAAAGQNLVVVGYSTLNGTTPKRTASNLIDSKIDVNGTLIIGSTGKIYTTSSGANICSSGKTGTVELQGSAGTDSKTYQGTQSGTTATKVDIPITSAKLHNGDGSYTPTAGAAANTTFVYCETHNKWERSAPSTQLNYNPNGGSGTMQVRTLDRSGTIADNGFTREGYSFSGWNTAADGSGEAYAAGDPAHFTIPTANVTLYAQWIPGKYTVTWKDEDGTVLETDTNVEAGTTPAYDGETPTKAGDAQYSYTFAGWTPEISAVTGDVTYTATYTQTVNTYTVTWKMDDGTLIDTTAVEYGAVPTHTAPTKTGSNQIAYVFAGWKSDDMTEASTTLPPVTGPVTYYAVFTQVNKPYIQFETGAEQDIVSGSMDNQYVMPGESVYLRENQYTRTGYEFHHWIDANGTVYQDQEKIIFTSTMASPLVLTAVWKQNDSVSDAQITVSWYDGFDGKMDEPIYYKAIDGSSAAAVEYYYHNASESLLYTSYDSANHEYRTLHQPTVPSHLGYYFKGWSIYVGDATEPITTTFSESADTNTISDQRLYENLSSLIKEDNSRVTFRIYAEYAKRNDTMSVNISYKLKDGTALTVSDGNKATAAAEAMIGKNYRAVAKSEITEGNNTYYFDHWEYNGNNTSAAELVIRPSEVAAISLTAVYSTTAPQNDAIVELKVIDYFAERVNNVPKIAVTLSYNVLQSGYTIQKVGFYCGRTKESVQNTPSASCTAKTPTNVTSGTYTLHISSKTDITDPQTTFYARPYVIDNNGNYHYAPENEIVALNWSELAGDDEKEVKVS